MMKDAVMIKTIKISELKPGMYINLPRAWKAHPFLRNSFTITSPGQIKKLIDYGITDVMIDEIKGMPSDAIVPEVEEPEKDFSNDINNISEQLKDALSDKKAPPEKRAQIIQDHSVDMMKSLWQYPTKEKIADFKNAVVTVVDTVLSDDATNRHLLKLTSYDYNTYIHSVNVGVLALALAKELFKKEDKHDMHALGAGFFLHDLGKVNIDEMIINKPGKLTEEEMIIMRRHPGMGFRLLHDTKQITEESRLIVLQHHERHNGTGYPKKLRGDDIHIYGRICSVADVFDALVSKRPYKTQKTPFDALRIMKEEMLDHFHKDVFQTFVLLFI
jgi:HD-GYP domain-containing protein (c-di-GMP phosphodiesterase class II)